MPHDLPRYRCHKVVRAAKIAEVAVAPYGRGAVLTFEGRSMEPHSVDAEWYRKHQPTAGGYYVVYEPDGYASFSPAKAFEEGYTPMADPRLLPAKCLDCGLDYAEFPMDMLLPRAQWLEIHPSEGGLLCALCIVRRASRVPGATAVHAVIEIAPRR